MEKYKTDITLWSSCCLYYTYIASGSIFVKENNLRPLDSMNYTWQKVRFVSGTEGQPYNPIGSCVNYIHVLCTFVSLFYWINMSKVTNEIKLHPLTADTCSNQCILLTLNAKATTISVTKMLKLDTSLLFGYISIILSSKDIAVNYTIIYTFSLW